MERALVRPVLADERSQCVDVSALERARHFLGELFHASQCEEHLRVPTLISARDGGDRISRDS